MRLMINDPTRAGGVALAQPSPHREIAKKLSKWAVYRPLFIYK